MFAALSSANTALPLAALSLGMLALGTTSLVVIGLATPMTAELGVSAGTAGTLVTAFAFTYAVASPLLQLIVGGRTDQRALIVGGLCVLSAGSLWGAFACSFHEFLVSRALAALGGLGLAALPATALLLLLLAVALFCVGGWPDTRGRFVS